MPPSEPSRAEALFTGGRGKKRNSRKFTVASYSSTQLQPLDNRRWCNLLAPKRGDLVAVVASLCSKGLRLVTTQLPEKFLPIGLGTNRSSYIRLSARFVLTEFSEVRLFRTRLPHEGAHPSLSCVFHPPVLSPSDHPKDQAHERKELAQSDLLLTDRC
jgi:hypothetical protein